MSELQKLRQLLGLRLQDVSFSTAISMSRLSGFEKSGEGLSRPQALELYEFYFSKFTYDLPAVREFLKDSE